MKHALTLLLLLALCTAAFATRPLRRAFHHRQADGTMLVLTKEGHAGCIFYATPDGKALIKDADGHYYYARLEGHEIVASQHMAHLRELRSPEEQEFVESQGVDLSRSAELLQRHHSPSPKNSASTADGMGLYGLSATGTVPSIGEINIPVIMVSFPDRDFLEESTTEKTSRRLNEAGYHDEANSVGSVRDYFTAQSYGMFSPTFTIVARVRASKSYAYYGENRGTANDIRVTELVAEAIDSAMARGVDFSAFRAADNTIPLVSIYHAGPGEHSAFESGSDKYIWAHYSSFSTTRSGTRFKSYFIGNETLQSYELGTKGDTLITGTAIDGIGVFCHEFGHALGLPDFYKTNGAQSYHTPDLWSIMDYGQYFRNGYAPIGYNAYERSFMGWLPFETLKADSAQLVEIAPLHKAEGKRCVRIVNPGNDKECYLMENRQPSTWFPQQMGHGMLLFHLDYLGSTWSANTLNNAQNNLRCMYVPADGQTQARGHGGTYAQFAGDLYPGTSGVNEIATLPVFTGGTVAASIYHIEELSDSTLRFAYLDPTVGLRKVRGQEQGAEATYFTLDGRRLTARPSRPGLYLEQLPGVPARKVIIR